MFNKFLFNWFATFILFTSLLCNVVAKEAVPNETITITIPGPLSGYKQRNPFVEELIKEIFAIQSIDLSLVYFTEPLPQGRAMEELSRNRKIDLNWSMSTIKREKSLRAIKIPIYKGMIGWRVFFIRKEDKNKFADIRQLSDLRQYKAIQRYDWPDYKVLLHNQLAVEGDFKFEYMSKALNVGFADYFPRSVLEIMREQSHERNKELIIEPSLLIKYPAAYYFFVNKKNKHLAKKIDKGFRALIKSGQFDELFARYFGEKISPLKLSERRVIALENPFFNN